MDDENVAAVMEETTFTKVRLKLNEQKVKLWQDPYYNTEQKCCNEPSLHELAVVLKNELNLPIPHIFQGLMSLQQNALEKLEARKRYDESGVLFIRIKWSKGLKARNRMVQIDANQTGTDLKIKLAGLVDKDPAVIKIIAGGKVLQEEKSLKDQGIKTSSTVMVVLVSSQSQKQQQIVDEQRKILLDQTKADAARLGSKDADKDDYYLQIADQSGRALQLPQEERKALVIAMSLHEKGREALHQGDYPSALVFLLEAEQEFSVCNSQLVNSVDNFAILNLDISWCYLMLQAVSEIPNAIHRLESCERMFKESYGSNLERLNTIKGSTGQEAALLMRLHLLQGIVAFHSGNEREAKLCLKKTKIESQLLEVNEQMLIQLMEMGYSMTEARLGLRAAQGNLEGAVMHINQRRQDKEEIVKKEKEEKELRKKRESVGKCADGSWVNIGYLETLERMGFPTKVATAALKQANNGLNQAVELLQEQPDLIQLAVEESEQIGDEDVAKLVSLGYSPTVARKVLKKEEGDVEAAAEYLFDNKGKLDDEFERAEKRRKKELKEDKQSYNRIKDSISKDEEDHLDIDLQLEKKFLDQYCQLLNIKDD